MKKALLILVVMSLFGGYAYAAGCQPEQDSQAIDAINKVKSEDAVRLGVEANVVVYRNEYIAAKSINRFYDGGNRDHLVGFEVEGPAVFNRIFHKETK